MFRGRSDASALPDVPAFMRRRRARRLCLTLGAVVAIAAMIWADWSGWLLFEGADVWRYDGREFEVVRVIDGDTLEIAAQDGGAETTRVRLWGIDAPELAKPDRPADPYAAESTEALTRWALGQRVRLSLEPTRVRGRYGRLLAHVALVSVAQKNASVLNERLLAEGYAFLDVRWTHSHAERYRLLAESAEREKRGVWAEASASGSEAEIQP